MTTWVRSIYNSSFPVPVIESRRKPVPNRRPPPRSAPAFRSTPKPTPAFRPKPNQRGPFSMAKYPPPPDLSHVVHRRTQEERQKEALRNKPFLHQSRSERRATFDLAVNDAMRGSGKPLTREEIIVSSALTRTVRKCEDVPLCRRAEESDYILSRTKALKHTVDLFVSVLNANGLRVCADHLLERLPGEPVWYAPGWIYRFVDKAQQTKRGVLMLDFGEDYWRSKPCIDEVYLSGIMNVPLTVAHIRNNRLTLAKVKVKAHKRPKYKFSNLPCCTVEHVVSGKYIAGAKGTPFSLHLKKIIWENVYS